MTRKKRKSAILIGIIGKTPLILPEKEVQFALNRKFSAYLNISNYSINKEKIVYLKRTKSALVEC